MHKLLGNVSLKTFRLSVFVFFFLQIRKLKRKNVSLQTNFKMFILTEDHWFTIQILEKTKQIFYELSNQQSKATVW